MSRETSPKKLKLYISSPKSFNRLASSYTQKPFYDYIKTGRKLLDSIGSLYSVRTTAYKYYQEYENRKKNQAIIEDNTWVPVNTETPSILMNTSDMATTNVINYILRKK
jgi:hypothetical protein